MVGATRAFLVAGAFSVLLLTAIVAQVPQSQRDKGQEWLSWSPAERSAFIDGFVTGYTNGSHKACLATEGLFEAGQPHQLADQPSARCLARLEMYSKDFDAYTTVITDFYAKHPEYRSIPFGYLIWFLTDNQYKTADQLYQMAQKGEIRTHF
jgi:hypothetical protein